MSQITTVTDDLKKISFVDAIYLFGSYAAESTRPFSDIDISVIVNKDIPKEKKEEMLGNSSLQIDISLFYDLPLNIQFRVIKDGKLLYYKDELLTHRIKVKTINDYLDFKHIITKHIIKCRI